MPVVKLLAFHQPADDQSPSMPADTGKQRRSGPANRRTRKADRRNAERLTEDIAPRRNPEVPDRRKP